MSWRRGWYVVPGNGRACYYEGSNGTGLSSCTEHTLADSEATHQWQTTDAGIVPMCEECRWAIARQVRGAFGVDEDEENTEP